MKLLFSFLFIFPVLLFSCSNESQKESNEKSNENTDSSAIVTNDINEEDVTNENSLPIVEKTDNWIKKIRKTDTIKWDGVYTDEYAESTNIELYMATSGGYHHATMGLPETESGRSYISYYFNEKMELCRMDIIEVRNGQWHDQISELYYFDKGNPIWLKTTHIYKDEVIGDTAYAPDPFTDDGYLIFYSTNDIDKHTTKR